MKRVSVALLFVATVLIQWPAASFAATSAEVLPSLSPMLERVSPGVVNIAARGSREIAENPLFSDPFFRRFFDLPEQPQPRERETRSVGSGVIIDAGEGYVVTNHHVIAEAEEITVVLSDRRRI